MSHDLHAITLRLRRTLCFGEVCCLQAFSYVSYCAVENDNGGVSTQLIPGDWTKLLSTSTDTFH